MVAAERRKRHNGHMRDPQELEKDAFLAQGELLARLLNHPEWESGWCELLRAMRLGALEELARCADPGEFRYWQGFAGALGEVLDRPGRIVREAAAAQQEEESAKPVIRPDLRAAIGLGVDRDGDV